VEGKVLKMQRKWVRVIEG